MIRHSYKTSESWRALPWKKFRRNLFRLQKRVYKAVQVGDKRKARSLQKLILKSTSARFLAIRQVSQLNAGKKTAGIDGKKSLSFEDRFNLEELLKMNSGNWKHQGLREIPIPKKDGTTRILKIPTIADRAWQCLAKYALEPAHEATFHARSYGFRTGRSAHDAQKYIFENLRSSSNGIEKRVIELDIEKCFDRINHSAIMDELIAPFGLKLGIFRCLKAGVNPEFPEQGTPQGGVVSPLLANIALNGIELGKPASISFGGLDLLREWLNRRRRLFTQEARELHLPQPKGVLLAGPPGTGKTLLAKNIANILNLPLLQLDIASLLGSLVGESEGNVRRALKTAEAIAPCVLWVDEIEKALSGTGDTSGVSQRILGNILTFMSESQCGVFVVATCNDPSALPSELKRKGRFDENFFVDLPTEPERVQILGIHLQRFGIHLESEYLEAIAANTAKFSGAELETLASEAALLAFDEGRPQQVTLADLETCCQTITPLAIQDAAAVERMQAWASTARRASSPVVAAKTQSLRAAKFRNMN